jgi:hypothetical protein
VFAGNGISQAPYRGENMRDSDHNGGRGTPECDNVDVEIPAENMRQRSPEGEQQESAVRQGDRSRHAEKTKGKRAAVEGNIDDKQEDGSARKRGGTERHRDMDAVEDEVLPDDSPSMGVPGQSRMTTTSKKPLRQWGRRQQSSKAKKALEKHDPLGPEWASLRDVPAVEVNRLGEPIGSFWDHMKPYIFDRASYIFPWHVDWNKQCEELKSRFIMRLRKLYRGPWEAKAVLKQVGNSLRERRNRLKKRFKIYSNPKAISRPKGCTLQSWQEIYRGLRDPIKRAKSDLCKLKAQERVAAGCTAITHRTGRGGYRGIVARFVSPSICFLAFPNDVRVWGKSRRCRSH